MESDEGEITEDDLYVHQSHINHLRKLYREFLNLVKHPLKTFQNLFQSFKISKGIPRDFQGMVAFFENTAIFGSVFSSGCTDDVCRYVWVGSTGEEYRVGFLYIRECRFQWR